MYRNNRQLKLEDFDFPFGRLDPDNRWVKLSEVIPWDTVDDIYAQNFVNNGHPAYPSRMAFGALVAKQMLDCSDRDLCLVIAENPYLQFLLGMERFEEGCPFAANSLVSFRKRFTEDGLKRINDLIIEDGYDDTDDDDGGGGGTLLMDATVAPSDITYPQDMKLLNDCREKLEGLIDSFHAQTSGTKPRTYRKCGRKDYLNWSKSKRRSAKTTRKAIRRQLGYVKRDLGYVGFYIDSGVDVTERQFRLTTIIKAVFDQQAHMYENRTHSAADRIVSLSQPWVRPIVRGKAHARTEFGAKVHASVEDGFARVERLDFDAYNETEYFKEVVENYHKRHGLWPKRVLADKIYRNRENLRWCKEREISMSGPKLGRPSKDEKLTREQKTQEYTDICDRNAVEGVFGTTKTAYGMSRVAARLEETTKTVISLAILAFNLKKKLRVSLSHIPEWFIAMFQSVASGSTLIFSLESRGY